MPDAVTPPGQRPGPSLFSRGSWLESSRTAAILRAETTGGLLLIVAAAVALVWSNTRWADAYDDLSSFAVGPEALHLHLSLETWAADGLLAIFFFVAGLELKREFVAGDLRDPRRAALPVVAAVGGMATPAVPGSRSASVCIPARRLWVRLGLRAAIISLLRLAIP